MRLHVLTPSVIYSGATPSCMLACFCTHMPLFVVASNCPELEHTTRWSRPVQAGQRGRYVGSPGKREARGGHGPRDAETRQEDYGKLRRLQRGAVLRLQETDKQHFVASWGLAARLCRFEREVKEKKRQRRFVFGDETCVVAFAPLLEVNGSMHTSGRYPMMTVTSDMKTSTNASASMQVHLCLEQEPRSSFIPPHPTPGISALWSSFQTAKTTVNRTAVFRISCSTMRCVYCQLHTEPLFFSFFLLQMRCVCCHKPPHSPARHPHHHNRRTPRGSAVRRRSSAGGTRTTTSSATRTSGSPPSTLAAPPWRLQRRPHHHHH